MSTSKKVHIIVTAKIVGVEIDEETGNELEYQSEEEIMEALCDPDVMGFDLCVMDSNCPLNCGESCRGDNSLPFCNKNTFKHKWIPIEDC